MSDPLGQIRDAMSDAMTDTMKRVARGEIPLIYIDRAEEILRAGEERQLSAARQITRRIR